MPRRSYITIALILALCSVVGLWGGGPMLRASVLPLESGAPYATVQSRRRLIESLVGAVSQRHLWETIRDLQDDDAIPGWDALRSRYCLAPELAVERDYIRARMEQAGLIVREQTFMLRGVPQTNLEGTLPGWGPEADLVYILCAHYDADSDIPFSTAPGADDNASGVAGLLEAARILAPHRFRHTLRFVAFAAEEEDLAGSDVYAEAARLAGDRIGGVINLDMIAWNNKNKHVLEIYARPDGASEALGIALMDAIAAYRIPLTPRYDAKKAPAYSDHHSFWLRGYPAILVTDETGERYPYYHTTKDTLDKLDLAHARRGVQAVVAMLAEQAGIIPVERDLTADGWAMALSDLVWAVRLQPRP